MKDNIKERIQEIVNSYNPIAPNSAASLLKALWLEFEPNKGIELIKEEQRTQQESIGIPISDTQIYWERDGKICKNVCRSLYSLSSNIMGYLWA